MCHPWIKIAYQSHVLYYSELLRFYHFVTDVELLLGDVFVWAKTGHNMVNDQYFIRDCFVAQFRQLKSKIRSASLSRRFHMKQYWFGPVVMLLPFKPWSITSLVRITSRRFFGGSRMRIFCLTQVESSLIGSFRTESLRMSPSPSDKWSSFTIKSSRIMGEVTFLAFVYPQLFHGDFSFSLCGMTSYSPSCFGGNVCWLFAQLWIQICVLLRLLHMLCLAFFTLCSFCVRIQLLRMFCGFCVHIQLLSSRCSMWTVLRDPILRVMSIFFACARCSWFTVWIPWKFCYWSW